MNRFIYVFDTDTKDKMEAAGYKLINECGTLFVFYLDEDIDYDFSLLNYAKYMLSDVLVF